MSHKVPVIKFCLLEIGVKSNGNPIQDEEGGVIRSISDTINNTQAVLDHILQFLMNTEESRTDMLSQLFEHCITIPHSWRFLTRTSREQHFSQSLGQELYFIRLQGHFKLRWEQRIMMRTIVVQ